MSYSVIKFGFGQTQGSDGVADMVSSQETSIFCFQEIHRYYFHYLYKPDSKRKITVVCKELHNLHIDNVS